MRDRDAFREDIPMLWADRAALRPSCSDAREVDLWKYMEEAGYKEQEI
jgi:hypothetical protein